MTSTREAGEKGIPFGTLGAYYNGALLTHELMSEGKFRKLLLEIAG